MNAIIENLKDNRKLSMKSGQAELVDVSSFVSKKGGNHTIKAIFKQSDSEDYERKGIDDVIRTSNINEFNKSMKRFYNLFTICNQQNVLLENLPNESWFSKVSEQPLEFDKTELFNKAVAERKDKIILLEETLKELSKQDNGEVLTYGYEYDQTSGTYKADFYKVDKDLFNKTMVAIENSLKTLIGNEYYISVKDSEKIKNGYTFIDYKVVGYYAV